MRSVGATIYKAVCAFLYNGKILKILTLFLLLECPNGHRYVITEVSIP